MSNSIIWCVILSLEIRLYRQSDFDRTRVRVLTINHKPNILITVSGFYVTWVHTLTRFDIM